MHCVEVCGVEGECEMYLNLNHNFILTYIK